MNKPTEKFVICLNNKEYRASLERHKLYHVLPDETASQLGMIRIIDESGTDYLYPENLFSPIAVPKSLYKQLLAA